MHLKIRILVTRTLSFDIFCKRKGDPSRSLPPPFYKCSMTREDYSSSIITRKKDGDLISTMGSDNSLGHQVKLLTRGLTETNRSIRNSFRRKERSHTKYSKCLFKYTNTLKVRYLYTHTHTHLSLFLNYNHSSVIGSLVCVYLY